MSVQPAKTAFTLYTSDCHARLKSESSTKPMGERMKAIAEGWRTMAESERQKYESMAGKDRERFLRESKARDDQVLREQAAKRADAEELGDRRRKRVVFSEQDQDNDDDDSEYDDDDERPKKAKKKARVVSKERREELAAKREARDRRDETVAKEAEALDKRAASSASARLQYLLSQSDIFSHFGCAKEAHAPPKKRGSVGRSPVKHREEAPKNDEEDAGEGVDGPPILLTQPPSVTGGKLRAYQLEGLNWMIRLDHHGVNGILADEMGLGKTLQCISMLSWLADAKNIKGPHLVLAPKSTLGNWMGEFTRWCPDGLRAVRFHGTKAERKEFVEDVLKPGEPSHLRDWDVVIATYEVANAERASLERISWRFVVIDEAHRIKNEASVFARTARALRSDRRLLITGTPLQNNLHELWALLNFLLPDVFASSEQFDEWFNLDVDDTDAKKRMISQLHKLLRPFVLRRLKADVEKSLPPKTETILFTGLSVKQKEVYKGLLKRDASLLLSGGGDLSEGTTASRTAISNIAMQLRKCCNHPYLFRGVEDRSLPPLGEHVVENCGKLKLLDKLLVKLFSRGHRVLIFSQMTHLLDILEDMMHMRGYQYCRIDGNTSYDDRDELIQAYNAPDSSKFVFLLSTRAGGLGINLQTADTCVLYDSDWNPQADLQAMDRCHRIGQKKPVHVYRLVTANTIEEKVVERATKKLKLDAMVVQQGRLSSGGAKQGPSKDEMLEAVKFGASHIFRSDENEVTDEDIDQILDRGREKTKAFMDKIQEKTEDEEDLLDFRLDGGGTTQEFEGVDYSKKENRASALAAKAAADHETLTQLVLADFDKSTRDRPRTAATYNLNLLSNGGVDRSSRRNNPVPPARRIPKMEDWQFYEKARLFEIAKIEEDAYAALDASGGDDPAAVEAAKENGVLPPELEEEKAKLLSAGFSTWTKTRFRDWTRMVGRHGRDNHAAIAQSMFDLGYPVDEAEVTLYSDVFWAKGAEALPEAEYERALRTIKKGEKAIEQNAAAQQNLRRYIDISGGPKRVMDRGIVDISAGAQNADDFERPFTRAEDRWLLTAADATGEAGEPDGDDLLAAASLSTGRFVFDHFMLSREPRELAARAALLAKKSEDFAAVEEKEIKAREMSGGKTAEQIGRELDEIDKLWAQAAADDAIADAKVNEIKNLLRSKQNEHRIILSKLPANMRASTQAASTSRNSVMRPPSTPFVAYVAEKAMALAVAENENRALVDRDIDVVTTLILERLEKAWQQEPEDVKLKYTDKCKPLPAHMSRHSVAPTDGSGARDDDDDEEVDAKKNSSQKSTPNIIIKIPKKRDSTPQVAHSMHDDDNDSQGPSVPKKKHDDNDSHGPSVPKKRHDESGPSVPKKRHDDDSIGGGGGRPPIPKKRPVASLEMAPPVDEYSSQPSSSPKIPKKVKRVSS